MHYYFFFIEQELVCSVNIEEVIDKFKNVSIKRRLIFLNIFINFKYLLFLN